ncbi:MAG: fatty acid/phospholipid synthesis protein PlsX [Chlorobi bacterium OLB5]|nr:MAG: fatty acid/phospholipid synthesis protein PlsX [Chlorobi bacterium OLB5]
MGGDNAPVNEVAGAIETVENNDGINITLVGKAGLIEKELKKYSYNSSRINIFNAEEVIEMHESPAEAMRKKPDSSLVQGLKLCRSGEADGFLSAGNTGAVMAASLFTLGRIANVSRPTIGSRFPTERGISLVFDVGANVDCKPLHLLQFAVMGSVFANHIYGIDNPKVGLLSVGEEKSKGDAVTVETHELLEKSGLNFIGNVEGRDIMKGETHVIVCDGFTGNIVLKFAESVLSLLKTKFKDYADRGIINKLKVGMAYGTLKDILKDFDYQEYGGVPLLGVNGVSIIGHGRSSPRAIMNMAIKAEQMVRAGINDIIAQKIKDINEYKI